MIAETTTNYPLEELCSTRGSIRGYELEQKVKCSLKADNPNERNLASELDNIYFHPIDTSDFKPLKFVYYRLLKRNGICSLRRDLCKSPRGSVYWNGDIKVENDLLREILLAKESVLGKDLKKAVEDTILPEWDWEIPDKETDDQERIQMSCRNFSKQLACYIYDYFINTEKPLCDDVYYCVTCKEYGTATVYRDQTKSPRGNKKTK